MFKKYLNSISSLADCSEKQIEEIISITREKDISIGEKYISVGEIPKSFAFVSKGLFRYFYMDNKGNELTKGFFPEYSFITAYSALIENRESYFTIEALENSKLFVIDYRKWKEMIGSKFYWQKFLVSLLEKGYCIKENREREFLLLDAEQRYLSFLNTYPNLEKRIKQHHIASFLGITPVSLSRIRKKCSSVNIG